MVAGEASGDEHAAQVVLDLKARQPNLKVCSLGGEKVRDAGAEQLFPLADYGVVGLFEVLKNYGFFRDVFEKTITWIEHVKPRCILLVDYPGFNLRLARALRQRGISRKGGGGVSVLQYISPQLWAWKPRRRFAMADILMVLGSFSLLRPNVTRMFLSLSPLLDTPLPTLPINLLLSMIQKAISFYFRVAGFNRSVGFCPFF